MLRSFIRLMLLESFRKFKFSTFLKLEQKNDYNETLRYLKSTLRHVGVGSSRNVFILSPKRVLKYAKNEAGFEQNATELKIYNSLTNKSIVSQVLLRDQVREIPSWIVSELVRPITDKRELLKFGIKVGILGLDTSNADKNIIDALNELRDLGLQISDLNEIDQWGITTDGRLVILDYGLDFNVLKKFY